MKIFILNSGGSSVKYKLLEMPEERILISGSVANLGKDNAVFHFESDSGIVRKEILPIQNHEKGINLILNSLTDKKIGILDKLADIDAVGHRVVHAGERFTGSVQINDKVITTIKECYDLAPLHNPPNVAGIEIMQKILPDIPMVAVFDNAFHAEIPDYVRTYAIPYKYYEKYRVRRYGFHGITFKYMTDRAAEILDRKPDGLRLVSLMLGSGCTANAFKDGKSVEISTGFTPLEGLVQSTRSGDLDPAVPLYIMRKENLTAEQMDQILNKESGWQGVSGISNDLREIIAESETGNELAELAIKMLVHRAKKYLGAYTAIMGGIDGLVFSGGVGEKSSLIRELISSGLEYLGIEIDKNLNTNLEGDGIISTPDSKARIIVVKTDEELVIARDTYQILSNINNKR